jgi:hypothetical protein
MCWKLQAICQTREEYLRTAQEQDSSECFCSCRRAQACQVVQGQELAGRAKSEARRPKAPKEVRNPKPGLDVLHLILRSGTMFGVKRSLNVSNSDFGLLSALGLRISALILPPPPPIPKPARPSPPPRRKRRLRPSFLLTLFVPRLFSSTLDSDWCRSGSVEPLGALAHDPSADEPLE